MESKEDTRNTWKTLWKGWKTTAVQRGMALALFCFSIMSRKWRFCTMV